MSEASPSLGPLVCVVGARPNYMKMAPLLRAFARERDLPGAMLIHTGQHYDVSMNDRLFADLGLPEPELNLGVGSGTHAVQTAEVMRRFEPIVDDLQPCCVIVVGDVNSTLACALVASKKQTPIAHIEAGLRSFDRTMPEEINRVVTDQLADLLYTTERDAAANLAREGIDGSRVHFVGNVMIDTLLEQRPRAIAPLETLRRAGTGGSPVERAGRFGVVTLHRPSNVDGRDALTASLEILCDTAQRLPLVWPVHPRTRASIERFGLTGLIARAPIALLEPQGYLEMLGLLANATLVLTDSGGIQEESTVLGVPCLTLRANTERPMTVTRGTNRVVGTDARRIVPELHEVLAAAMPARPSLPLWDGLAASRIVEILEDEVRSGRIGANVAPAVS